MTSAIPFLTPIVFERPPETGLEKAAAAFEGFFWPSGKRAVVISQPKGPDNASDVELQDYAPSCTWLTVLKAILCYTIIIPLLVAIIKFVIRKQLTLHVINPPKDADPVQETAQAVLPQRAALE